VDEINFARHRLERARRVGAVLPREPRAQGGGQGRDGRPGRPAHAARRAGREPRRRAQAGRGAGGGRRARARLRLQRREARLQQDPVRRHEGLRPADDLAVISLQLVRHRRGSCG